MNLSRREIMKLIAGSLPAYYASSALSLAAGTAPASTATKPAESAATQGLKDVYKGKFLIGTAGDLPRGYSEIELANIKANYDIVTPENCMKPQGTQPSEGNFSFATPDALVAWCEQNGLKVWGHTLCWHSQTPQFFFQGTREEALARLQKHIETVVGHFAGKLVGWDVVNESIADNGDGQTENLRNSSWYRLVGPDVLNKAFEWAHKADPAAQLYYNDYNIEQDAADNKGKYPSSLLLLKRLLDAKVPINGVGIQGHWHLYTRVDNIEKAIEGYKALGLKVSISELDVTTNETNSGAFNPGAAGGTRRGQGRGADANTPAAAPRGPAAMAPAQNSVMAAIGAAPGDANGVGRGAGRGGMMGGGMGAGMMGGGMMGGGRRGGTPPSPELLEKQANIYKQIFQIFKKNADVISRVTFWGISDNRSWRAGQNPLLYDGQYNPKPAYKAVIDVGLGK